MARSSLRVSLVAGLSVMALAACAPPSDNGGSDSGSGGGSDASDRDVRRGPRRHGRAGQGGQEGGRAQRHRAAARTGPTTPTSSRRFGDEVRHQGELRAAGRRQPGRDQRRQVAQGHDAGAGRLRPRPVRGAGEHLACSPTYKVATWDDVPADFKDANGAWINDYGGYMSIGYDSSKVPDVTGLDDLLGPEFKGKVALNGDPTQAGAAFSGVMMASLASGGSADDIAPGVDFFGKLKKAGNFLPVDPTSGDHRVRPDAGRHRLGLPERGRVQEARKLEGRRPGQRRRRRLLLPGHQRGRAAPGRGSALGGVPLLRRGPEPAGSPAAPARCGPRRWSRPARSTRRRTTRCPRSTARRSPRRSPRPRRRRRTSAPTGRRPSAEHAHRRTGRVT